MSWIEAPKGGMSYLMINYINENYTVFWKHPESTCHDWNIFLLGEGHSDTSARKVNGFFISSFATPGSFFLVESHLYLQQTKTPKHNMRTFAVETSHIQPTDVLGWDNSDFLITKEPLILAYTVVSAIFIKYYNDLDVLAQINWKLELEKLLLETDYEFQDELNFKPFLEKAICEVANEMDTFVKKQLIPIIESLASLIDQIKLDEKKLLIEKCTPEEYLNFSSVLHTKRVEVLKIEGNLDACLHEKRLELMDKQHSYSNAADFPDRTQCMTKTLDHVSNLIANSESRAFLIAGTNHLRKNHNMSPERSKLCALETLYHFLADHKNIVVLGPK